MIRTIAQGFPEMVVGAGAVLDVETAEQCLDAGARFITSTGMIPAVIEETLKANVVCIPGALTPTEAIACWKAGADFVKIFSCCSLGWGPLRPIAQTAIAGGQDHSCGRSDHKECRRFYSRRSVSSWPRNGFAPPGNRQAPAEPPHPRAVPSLSGIREGYQLIAVGTEAPQRTQPTRLHVHASFM